MEAPGRRVENAEKRGAGKKSATNTVHGAHEKFPVLRPVQKKLVSEDGSTTHGNTVRTAPTLDSGGTAMAKSVRSAYTAIGENPELGQQNCRPGVVGTGQLESHELYGESFDFVVGDNRPQLGTEEVGTADLDLEMGTEEASRGRSRAPDVREQFDNERKGGWARKIQPGRTFASLLNANPIGKKMKMDYVEPVMEGEQFVFVPQDEVILQAKKKWENYLVGYFISGSLALSSVERAARGYWAKLGLGRILADATGLYFFEIPAANERMRILEEGPWLFYGRGMVLQQWTPDLTLCKQTHDRIPLWARFHKVPLTLWTAAGLSGIASLVGKPLYADSYTDNMKKIDFARICIEVEARKPLPETVLVHMAGEVLQIPVDYQWKPMRCSKCEVFGHVCKIGKEGKQRMDVAPAAGTGQVERTTVQVQDKYKTSTGQVLMTPVQHTTEEGFIVVQSRKKNNKGKSPTKDESKSVDKEEPTLVQRRKSIRADVIGEEIRGTEPHPLTDEATRGIREVVPMTDDFDHTLQGMVQTVNQTADGNGQLQTGHKKKRSVEVVLASPARSSSETNNSDESDAENDSSEDSSCSESVGRLKHLRTGCGGPGMEKDYNSKLGNQIMGKEKIQKESGVNKVVAAMPNNQFQVENHMVNSKKAKKGARGSKHRKR